MDAPSWSIDDRQLLSGVAAGDRQALAGLYQRHAPALLGYLRRIAFDAGLAEEILQDTFLAVWKAAPSFEGRSAVRTWIYGIGRRQAYNKLRKTPPPTPVDADESWANQADTAPSPEEVSLAQLSGDQLRKLIAQLSTVHQEVLHLSLAGGMSTDELAALLEVPPGTVKSRLSNARRLLREKAVAEGVLP